MRRRGIIGEKKPLVLTLSSYSYNATPAEGTTTVYAYYGGVPISDLTTSMITTPWEIENVSVNSSGKITMSFRWNTSTTSTQTSTMTLTYQGQTVSYTITQPKDYAVSTSNSYYTYGDCGSIRDRITISVTNNGDGTSTAVNDLTYPYTLKNVTVTTTTYASGNTKKTRTTTSSTQKTCTFPKEYLKFDQSKSGSYVLINQHLSKSEDDYNIDMFTMNSITSVSLYFDTKDDGAWYEINISTGGWATNPTSVKLNVNGGETSAD